LSEVDPNFAGFWAAIFFAEGPPKFWDIDYNIELTLDYVTKKTKII